MKTYRIFAISHKEFLHIWRDWRSLCMTLIIPMFMMILFGYALTLDVENVTYVVWDQSRSPQSREFLGRFQGSSYFSKVDRYPVDYHLINQLVDSQEAKIALVIPSDFARLLENGRQASVQLIADGTDSNAATITLGYAESIVNKYNEDIKTKHLAKEGVIGLPRPVIAKPRIWYNEDLNSHNNIVPGLIAVIMMVISALITALTISREWDQGTMEQLISTPIKKHELIIGKLIPYFLFGMFDVLTIFFMGQFFFEIPFRGSFIFLMCMSSIFLIGALSLGFVISVYAKTQLLASQLAIMATLLPSYLLSGFFTNINNMPYVIQLVTYLVPARYFIVILKGIYLKGVGVDVMYIEVIFLMIFSIVMFSLANKLFKKKLM